MEAFENAIKSGKMVVAENTSDQCERTKTEVFENAVKSGYPQKRRFLNTFQCPTMSFTKPEQCERTKTDVLTSVFVQKRSNVNE